MANSLVQQRDSHLSANSISLAYSSNNSAGNLLVAAVSWQNIGSSAGLAVSDTLNGAWVQDKVQLGVTTGSVALYSFRGCAAGANTVTASITSAGGTMELAIYEFSGGGNTAWTLTTTASAASGTSSAPSPGAMTINSGDVCVSYALVAGTASGGAAGWTFTATGNGNGKEYQISSTTSVTGSFTPAQTYWEAVSSAYQSSPVLHFPLAIADTSTVLTLGIENNRHFPTAIADTSTVLTLGLEVNRHFPAAIADISTVTALGFHITGGGPYATLIYSDVDPVLSAGSNYWPATVGGTVNALTLSNSPPLTSLINGTTFTFPTLGSNTGAVTCNVDSIGVLPVVTPGGTALTGKEMRTPLVTLFYANSKFYLAWTWSWWMPT
jgi:hypothetical protein